MDRIVGRDRELSRVIQILSRRSKNNPCLIGEPGVGKTAIAEGLALKIVNGTAPDENGNVDVPGGTVTDEHINALIDAKLAELPSVPTYTGEVEVE